MSVVVITPPPPLVDLATAKSHLRVEAANTDDDALITLQLAAAQAELDGPGGWLERAIGLQTLELRQDSFDAGDWRVGPAFAWEVGWADFGAGLWPFATRITLPFPPFVSVTSVIYEDGTGTDQVLTPSGWEATDEGLEPAFGTVWPSGRTDANAVRIQYQAGYAAAAVPAPIKYAILLMVGDLYENRSASVIDARAVVATNPTVERLLERYRVWA